MKLENVYTDRVNDIVFSTDGKTFFSSNNDGSVTTWEYKCGRYMTKLYDQPHSVENISVLKHQ